MKNLELITNETKKLTILDERVYGKKGIIIMINDGFITCSAIFKDKKNANKYNRNELNDIEKLYNLAKETKFPNSID